MGEWLKPHASKACIRGTVSGVRIPLSPPYFSKLFGNNHLTGRQRWLYLIYTEAGSQISCFRNQEVSPPESESRWPSTSPRGSVFKERAGGSALLYIQRITESNRMPSS